MAFTVILLKDTQKGDPGGATIFLSQEYMPHKERDASGAVLPNQDWQHPAPEVLHYCMVGVLTCDRRAEQILEAMLNLGAGQMGGHVRVLSLDECVWLTDQLEGWEDRRAREEEEEAERERQHWAEIEAKELARTPIYGFCERCNGTTEECKGPSHRGWNQCMRCGGGLGDPACRHCINCCDLPYREKREELLGRPILYATEEPPV